jgi:hypothetical protein
MGIFLESSTESSNQDRQEIEIRTLDRENFSIDGSNASLPASEFAQLPEDAEVYRTMQRADTVTYPHFPHVDNTTQPAAVVAVGK